MTTKVVKCTYQDLKTSKDCVLELGHGSTCWDGRVATKNNWEDEFVRWARAVQKTTKLYDGTDFCALCGTDPKMLIDKIRSLLASQRQEMVEVVEGMKKESCEHTLFALFKKGETCGYCGNNDMSHYNLALDDVLKKLHE